MRKRTAMMIGAGVLLAASVFFLTRGRDGTPPALAPGFPPVFPGASLEGNRSAAVKGGWQRAFLYTAPGKAEAIIAFYRRALVGAGLLVMAEGGGTYGGMLRAQDKSAKRLIYVDVDAPEEAPNQPPKVTVTIVDTR